MINQRRVSLGLRQRALATRGGMSDTYIAQLETRERINPTLAVRKPLANVLKITVGA